ncbi:MAG: hypothetical protein ACI8RD_009458 [Bacillariaceae sp.]|jgi:hypothetical protein
MPMSIVGSNGGSYRKINPQLSQSIESLKTICKSLNKSKQHWWLSQNTLQSIEEMKSSRMKERQQKDLLDEAQQEYNSDDGDGDGDNNMYTDQNHSRHEGEGEENSIDDEEDDDDEMIDLQQGSEDQRLCLSADNDNDDDIDEINCEDDS